MAITFRCTMSSSPSNHCVDSSSTVFQHHLQNEPDVYFEITGSKYKESPSVYKEKGGLHSTRLPHLQKVQRMGPSTQAVYVKWDLDHVPHYQLARDRRKEVCDVLSSNSIPIETFDHTKSIIKEDDIAIYNVNTPEFDRYAKPHYDRIDFESILKRVLHSEASDTTERGNIALSVGLATLNQKHSGPKGVASPQVILATDQFLVEQMCIMSELVTYVSMQIYNDLVNFFGGTDNKKHSKNKKFLRYEKAPNVLGDNLYTAVFDCRTTYNLTDTPGVPFYNYGIKRICNGVRYYKTGPSARMALIVELLVRIALGEIKGAGMNLRNWHRLLLPDSRKDTNEDFCVIHSSHYALVPQLPVGVLFFMDASDYLPYPLVYFWSCGNFMTLIERSLCLMFIEEIQYGPMLVYWLTILIVPFQRNWQ